MKNTLLPVLLFFTLFACNSDDDNSSNNEQDENVSAIIRLTKVDIANDIITITNFGEESKDVGSYWLCLGPGRYLQISNGTDQSTNLSENASLDISFNVDLDADGLGLFSENTFGSSSPSILLDFVQYGEANQPRVGQAVDAGRWGANSDFIPTANSIEYIGNATDVGVAFWN